VGVSYTREVFEEALAHIAQKATLGGGVSQEGGGQKKKKRGKGKSLSRKCFETLLVRGTIDWEASL